MTKKRTKKKTDVYADVTARIVADIEAGTPTWVKPWADSASGGMALWFSSMNASTGKLYRGINQLILAAAAAEHGFTVPLWVTFKQAQAMGGCVQKGQRSPAKVVFWIKREISAPTPDNPDATDEIPFMRTTSVFNIEQTDVPREKWERLVPETLVPADEADRLDASERIEILERFVSNTGADIIERGDRACYIPSADAIRMPKFETFESAGSYYSTILHELAHWTGAPSRLNREFGRRFGDQAYAVEELTAELTSAFLCASLGVPGALRHSEYLGAWVKLMKADTRAVFKAATAAQAAADYILECSSEGEEAGGEEAAA